MPLHFAIPLNETNLIETNKLIIWYHANGKGRRSHRKNINQSKSDLSATKRKIPTPNVYANLVNHLTLGGKEDRSIAPPIAVMMAATTDKIQISMARSERVRGVGRKSLYPGCMTLDVETMEWRGRGQGGVPWRGALCPMPYFR